MAGHKYNQGGTTSTIDQNSNSRQIVEEYFIKKALIEARKQQYFMPLADVVAMPKHHGQKISQYVYVPLLDDENKNDQGLDATGAQYADGNLYGSSKDIGTIPGKMPILGEDGGRVNRVGFSRKLIEGEIQNLGFFSEYTRDSMNFDSDADLMMHLQRETINGAHEIVEDLLQIDLINAAGTIRYTGAATSIATTEEEVTIDDLMHLGIDLTNKRTPKHTTIITGTKYTDTRVIPACRVLYIGSELVPLLKRMKDLHNDRAFIPVQHYAAGTTVMNGEIGSIDDFRVIVHPEMMKWAGGGAAGTDPMYYGDGTNYDVFPMLVVGDKSFTCIGFQTNGKTVNFEQIHKKPGKATADYRDPYGKTGFMSIQWWYGFMAMRPERIGLILTTAKK